jgi:hypothetical protein
MDFETRNPIHHDKSSNPKKVVNHQVIKQISFNKYSITSKKKNPLFRKKKHLKMNSETKDNLIKLKGETELVNNSEDGDELVEKFVFVEKHEDENLKNDSLDTSTADNVFEKEIQEEGNDEDEMEKLGESLIRDLISQIKISNERYEKQEQFSNHLLKKLEKLEKGSIIL